MHIVLFVLHPTIQCLNWGIYYNYARRYGLLPAGASLASLSANTHFTNQSKRIIIYTHNAISPVNGDMHMMSHVHNNQKYDTCRGL